MILNKTNENGLSPIIGVILLIALFTGLVVLLSFNLFSSNIGVVTESMDAEIDFVTEETGVSVSVFHNENINKLIVRYEDGRIQEIDMNSSSSQNVNFGPGDYYLIAQNDRNERLLSQLTVDKLLEIDVPTFVSTNEEIEYNINTNIDEKNIDSYNWDFGNGESSSEPNPTNIYEDDGIFNTELTIVVDGEEITNNLEITVDSSMATPSEPNDIEEVNNDLDGDGTEQSPYIIMTDHDLQSINAELDAHYKLGQNINASLTNNWNGESGFKPLGNKNSKFEGSINGSGYRIFGLDINRGETSYVGLFGHTNTAEISNIILSDTNIIGQNEVGGIVGLNQNSEITNSNIEGNIFGDGNFRVGGIVGYNKNNSKIISSYSDTIVVGNQINVMGGLVGKNEDSLIEKSYNLGDIEGDSDNIGGLVGSNVINGEIKDSYSQGHITGNNNTYVGGIVGYNKNGVIMRTYSTNRITTEGIKGGLIGRNDDELYDSYWNSEIGESKSIGNNTSSETVSNDIGLMTEEMQGNNAESNMTTFDFDNIWSIVVEPTKDYPTVN